MDQVSIKYSNILNLPKFGFLVGKQTVWQPCRRAVLKTLEWFCRLFWRLDDIIKRMHFIKAKIFGGHCYDLFLRKSWLTRRGFRRKWQLCWGRLNYHYICIQLFRRKVAKIAENRDHNIDPLFGNELMSHAIQEASKCCPPTVKLCMVK
jgi:hypothetical protein